MRKITISAPTREETKSVLRHPLMVSVGTVFLGWLAVQLYDANTVDSEVAATVTAVPAIELRLQAEETNTAQVAKQMQVQAVQTAFTGRKIASQDIRRIQVKPRESWSVEEVDEYRNAESRLEYNQKILDTAMGMPE